MTDDKAPPTSPAPMGELAPPPQPPDSRHPQAGTWAAPASPSKRRGRGVAIVVVSVLAVIGVRGAIRAIGGDKPTFRDPKVGDCLATVPVAPTLGDASVEFVDCGSQHAAEVVGRVEHTAPPGTLIRGRMPGNPAAATECFARAVDYVGSMFDTELNVEVAFPTEQRWSEGERTVTCVVISAGGANRTGSARATVTPAAPRRTSERSRT